MFTNCLHKDVLEEVSENPSKSQNLPPEALHLSFLTWVEYSKTLLQACNFQQPFKVVVQGCICSYSYSIIM